MAPATGPPRRVKLLLDVHHSRIAAERLRADGYDVQAAADAAVVAALPDEELLRQASADGRAVVTENAKDFDRIVRSWVATGEHHAGVIFTSPRRFHRGSTGYPENLIVALTRFLARPPVTEFDWVHWLQ
jgi:Domain of unknown function (DUF5615)